MDQFIAAVLDWRNAAGAVFIVLAIETVKPVVLRPFARNRGLNPADVYNAAVFILALFTGIIIALWVRADMRTIDTLARIALLTVTAVLAYKYGLDKLKDRVFGGQK